MPLPGAPERDRGIADAYDAADRDWRDSAGRVVAYLAEIRPAFTTDAVWALLDRYAIPPPREPRALGGVMQRARADGLIAPTDDFRPTVRPIAHRQPIRVWRSLVHRP